MNIEQEYARLRALADAATPGPWAISISAPSIIKRHYEFAPDQGPLIGSTMGNDESGFYVSERERGTNAAFITAAHDMMALIEAMRIRIAEFEQRANAGSAFLDEALNSGDGVHRP